MSNYTVVAAVSEALRLVLWRAIEADPTTMQIVGAESAIALRNPTETARDSANRLSLWLYQITENEFMKNQPMVRTGNPEVDSFPPLALNFNYLITPFATSGEGDHLLLGKTMQVLYDHSTLILSDKSDRLAEELRIILCNLNLEQLTRIWEALQQPYRLSVCYQIRVSQIDSGRIGTDARVLDRSMLVPGSAMRMGGAA